MSRLPGPPRRRFRVSVRVLMGLVLAVGGGAGWLAHRIRTQRWAIATLEGQGARITLTHQSWEGSYGGPAHFDAEPPGPRWLRRWLGDELFQSVGAVEMWQSPEPADLSPLAACDRLEYLELFLVPIPDRGLGALRGLRHLKTVRLTGDAVTDSALEDLARVESIEDLEVDRSPATPAGWGHLEQLSNLRSLQITSSQLDGVAIDRWSRGMSRLEHLELGINAGLAVGDAELVALARLDQLRHLGIDGSRVTDGGLAALARLPHLVYLSLHASPELTDAGLATVATFPALERLILYRAPRVTDAGLARLAAAPHLDRLTLGRTQITPEGAAAFRRSAPKVKFDVID